MCILLSAFGSPTCGSDEFFILANEGPRRTEGDPGGSRGTQGDLGGPRGTQGDPGGHRGIQENPEGPMGDPETHFHGRKQASDGSFSPKKMAIFFAEMVSAKYRTGLPMKRNNT